MAKFHPLSALEHLLKMDTNIFKEELYYPWYAQAQSIQLIIASWLLALILVNTWVIWVSAVSWPLPLIISFVLSVVLAGGYFAIITQAKKKAQKETLKQIMSLEKRQFMQNIAPFVSHDQKMTAKRIYSHVDFSPKEYISLTIATKCRAVLNTQSFINDIERLFADQTQPAPVFKDDDYCDTVFKVPDIAKKNYEKLKNQSTFNDELRITPQAQAAILAKVREAANRPALGRE